MSRKSRLQSHVNAETVWKPADLEAEHRAVSFVIGDTDVAMVVANTEAKIVVLWHNKLQKWSLPVGKVETHQSFEEALKQEAREELGVEVTEHERLGVFEHVYQREGQHVKIESCLFRVLSYKGDVRNNEPHKHRELRFVTLAELKRLTPVADTILDFLKCA